MGHWPIGVKKGKHEGEFQITFIVLEEKSCTQELIKWDLVPNVLQTQSDTEVSQSTMNKDRPNLMGVGKAL